MGAILAGAVLAIAPARAVLTYAEDDVLLGFYATGGQGSSQSYVVNLGQASIYRDYTGSFFDLSVGNIGADLTAVYGSDWNTRSDVFWGVFAANYNTVVGSDPANTLYAGKPRSDIAIPADAYNRGSASTQSGPASRIHSLGGLFSSGQTSATANSSVATIQDSSLNNDFAQFQDAVLSTSFSYFNGALGNFGSGASGTALDFFRMPTGSSGLLGTQEGTFTISNAGVVRFTAAAVPEPSILLLGMIAAGALGVIGVRRRLTQG